MAVRSRSSIGALSHSLINRSTEPSSAPGRVEDKPRAGIIGQLAIQLPAYSHVGVSGTSQTVCPFHK